MVIQEYDSLGVKVKVRVYESVEEGDKAAGVVGAVLKECNNNLTYRGSLADFRDLFCSRLEKETGIERLRRDSGKKDESGEPIMVLDESEGRYKNRIEALIEAKKISPVNFQQIADEISELKDEEGNYILQVDIKQPERKATGPKVLPKMYLETAKSLFAKGKQQKVADKIMGESGTSVNFTGDVEKDVIALGWAIKANEDAKRKAALAEYD